MNLQARLARAADRTALAEWRQWAASLVACLPAPYQDEAERTLLACQGEETREAALRALEACPVPYRQALKGAMEADQAARPEWAAGLETEAAFWADYLFPLARRLSEGWTP